MQGHGAASALASLKGKVLPKTQPRQWSGTARVPTKAIHLAQYRVCAGAFVLYLPAFLFLMRCSHGCVVCTTSPPSQLGMCYFRGTGVDVDREEAMGWLHLSADQGCDEALMLLRTIAEGSGVSQ
eukprot:TRINITY_DN2857_c0_g1_i7.p2 TRINITY_DN2857_c0_g1~~TRINITY_DN2857_c0_g1_i7.p2  ORF type:complete len:125 (-),score=11.00 TRINITY_DN2857_c0_g1_i7:84-458(-)